MEESITPPAKQFVELAANGDPQITRVILNWTIENIEDLHRKIVELERKEQEVKETLEYSKNRLIRLEAVKEVLNAKHFLKKP